MHKNRLHFFAFMSLLTIASLVAACGALPSPTPAPLVLAPTTTVVPPTATSVPPTPAPPTATRQPPTATTVPPTATRQPPTPAPPAATPTPLPALASELAGLVKAALPKPSGTPGPGNTDVFAVQLKTNTGDLWLAHTTGMRIFQPLVNHFLAIYRRSATGWQQVSKLDIPTPDYLSVASVKQVQLEAERIWLQVDGGVGAHSGSFSLLSFDGTTLRLELDHISSSPGGSRVEDINGDKMSDVVLDNTNYYVFCYACGVRYFSYEVRSWDGAKLAEVKLAPLPASAPAALRTPVNQAVALAQAGLWKDAQAAIAQVTSADPTVVWDAALIKLHAEPFAKQANSGPYPLLDHVFYGDYAAALDDMRPYTPEQIFSAKSPLLTMQIAQGWEKSVANWITKTTTLAVGASPNLAAAYFLRGWANAIASPGSAAAVADVEKALTLAPAEPLYAASAAYLRKK